MDLISLSLQRNCLLVPKNAPLFVKYDSSRHETQYPYFKLLDDLEYQIVTNIEMCNEYNLQHYSEFLYTRLIENNFLKGSTTLSDLEWSFYDRVFCLYVISLFHLKKYSQIIAQVLPLYIAHFVNSESNSIDITSSMYTSTILHYSTLSLKNITKVKSELSIFHCTDQFFLMICFFQENLAAKELVSKNCLQFTYSELNSLCPEDIRAINSKLKNDTQLFGTPDISSYLYSLSEFSNQLKLKLPSSSLNYVADKSDSFFLLSLSLLFNPHNLAALEVKYQMENEYDFHLNINAQGKYSDILDTNMSTYLPNKEKSHLLQWDIDYLVYNVSRVYSEFYKNNFYGCKELMDSPDFVGFFYSENKSPKDDNFMKTKHHNNLNLAYYYLKSLVEVYEFEAAFEFANKVFDFSNNDIPIIDFDYNGSMIDYATETYNLISVLTWQCYKTTGDLKYLLYLKDLLLFFSQRKATGKVYSMIALGLMYSCLDQTDKSIELLEKAVLKHPRYLYTYYLLGNEYMVKEEFREAIKMFFMVQSKGYSTYKVHYSLGVAYLMLGEYRESILHLARGLQCNRVNIVLLSTYGIVLEKVGKQEEMLRYFELVLELYDDFGKLSNATTSNVFRENYVNMALYKLAFHKFASQQDVKGALSLLSRFDKAGMSSGVGKYDSTLINIYSLLEEIYKHLGDHRTSNAFANKVLSLESVNQGSKL
ncbi:hypothetical protein ACO0R3_002069 [Hanseniaspora guilliermondii]